MPEYTSPADYAAQTEKWRNFFKIAVHLQYAEQVKVATEQIERLRTSDPSEYDRFMSDARAWGVRETAAIAYTNEISAPVSPQPSGRTRDHGDYIVLSLFTADGVLAVAMEHSFTTGDVSVGHIICADSNTKWRYTATCVAYAENGLPIASFLGKVSKTAPTESNVNSDYVATSSKRLAYRKKGTCKIRCEYVGATNVKPSDSPQYNDGKERVPARYTR